MKVAALALLLGALAAGAGCRTVREIEEPLAETTLIVTRAGDATTLRWNSRRGVTYLVLYADRREAKARWRPLPGAERVRGTGETITLTDRIPASQVRYYRVQMAPGSR